MSRRPHARRQTAVRDAFTPKLLAEVAVGAVKDSLGVRPSQVRVCRGRAPGVYILLADLPSGTHLGFLDLEWRGSSLYVTAQVDELPGDWEEEFATLSGGVVLVGHCD